MTIDAHLIILCEEYIEAVDIYRADPTADGVSSARTMAHEAVLEYTGLTRDTVDYAWCRNVVSEGRKR